MQDSKTISGSIVHITDGAEADARAIVVEIEPVQSGSGTPSPDNVRPISGWESVTVADYAKNMVTEQTNDIQPCFIRAGTQVIASVKKISGDINCVFRYFRKDGTQIDYWELSFEQDGRFWRGVNIQEDVYFIKFDDRSTLTITDRQVRISGTGVITYDPTLAHVATTDLGRTVYGGTLDVVSGVLTVDRAIVDLGSLTWSVLSGSPYGNFSTTALAQLAKQDKTEPTYICSAYNEVAYNTASSTADNYIWLNNNKTLIVKDTSKSSMTAADFKTAMNGVQLVYELATPTTAQLTGQQIELLRDCFVWADAGDITVTYETELLDGRFHKIKVNDNSIIAPNNFELEREDVYTAEYTTCTGKLIADKIGWKYADTTMQWDTLPDDMLAILTGTTGAFTLKFTDSDGSHTENVIRLGVRNTATRFTDDFGNALWRNIELEVSFTNVH